VKEQQQKMYVWQRLKTYEHVGKAFIHQRQRHDERQMNLPQRQTTKKSQSSKITKHEGTKNDEQWTMTCLMILKDVESNEC
jgi:hypothetical protein